MRGYLSYTYFTLESCMLLLLLADVRLHERLWPQRNDKVGRELI